MSEIKYYARDYGDILIPVIEETFTSAKGEVLSVSNAHNPDTDTEITKADYDNLVVVHNQRVIDAKAAKAERRAQKKVAKSALKTTTKAKLLALGFTNDEAEYLIGGGKIPPQANKPNRGN